MNSAYHSQNIRAYAGSVRECLKQNSDCMIAAVTASDVILEIHLADAQVRQLIADLEAVLKSNAARKRKARRK